MAGRGPHDPIRQQMEAALKMIELRQAENARQQNAQEGAQTRAQIAEENNRTRQSGIDTASADRAATLEMERGKNDQLGASREELRRSQQLDTVTKLLATTPPGSPEYKQLSAHAMKLAGVDVAAAGATPDAGAGLRSAVQSGAIKVHGGQPQVAGTQPTPQPATTTPAPVAANTGATAPTPATPPAVGPTGAVDQGFGFAPNGYPILPNTPEPTLGRDTINGRPAGEQLAAHAHGVEPESPSGRLAFAALNQDRSTAQASPSSPVPAGATPTGIKGPNQYPSPIGPPFSPAALAAQPQVGGGGIPTNPAGEHQWPSGAASSGTQSGAWLADQFKQLPITFSPGASNQAQDRAQVAKLKKPEDLVTQQ